MILMMMIFMQIKRQIEWLAACQRGGGMEDGNHERSFGVHLGSTVFLAPVSLALYQRNEIYRYQPSPDCTQSQESKFEVIKSHDLRQQKKRQKYKR